MGRTVSLQEVASHDGRDGSMWIVVANEVYDISAFAPKHPGGSILRLAAGREATALFESYHPGAALPRARSVLARRGKHIGTLAPEDAVPYGNPEFFDTVRARVDAQLEQEGLGYHAHAWRCTLEAWICLGIAAACWYLRVFAGSYLAAIVAGVIMARMGFLMHSGNHGAQGRNRWRNGHLAYLMEFIGGSSFVWRHTHQVAHHTAPNIHGKDNDCEIGTPLLRFHPEIPWRPWHRIQPLLLGIGMSFGMIKWIISDVVQLSRGRSVNIGYHVGRRMWRRSLAFKAGWIAIHLVVPMVTLGPLHGIATTVVLLAVGAYYMETVFIVNHLQRDLVPTQGRHWARQQVQGTANWASGSRWANFVSGGLNHQIEHHLFPSMSIHLYPTIAPIVRQTCEEFGLAYRDYPGFLSALGNTTRYLHELGRPEPSMGHDRATA